MTELPHFARPYDWPGIDAAVREVGGAILEGWLELDERARLDQEIDRYLGRHAEAALPESGSEGYDLFLGHKTLRLHGLIEKVPGSADLIARKELVEWAERVLEPVASSVLLNAGELIQIEPGEPAQYLHRDSDSWPLPVGDDPIIVNAIIALDDCTVQNGATYVAPGSFRWEAGRQARADELARAVMERGDALLFRGDVVHGGGENVSSERRRVVSISYCAGWLRPVENSFLNVSRSTASRLPEEVAGLLGYRAYDGSRERGGLIGLFENGDPARALQGASE